MREGTYNVQLQLKKKKTIDKMKQTNIYIPGLIITLIVLFSCTRQWKSNNVDNSTLKNQPADTTNSDPVAEASMANPVLMEYGSDIGTMFNTYYRVGSIDKMIPLLDKQTKQHYSMSELQKSLSKLDLGFELKLTGMKDSSDCKILSYSCQIDATKVIKRLVVVIENDTARIVPSNLKNGKIFY